MALQQIEGDVFGDDLAVCLECVGIARAELGGDFETDVEELAKMGIVLRVCRNVAQGVDVLFAAPIVHVRGAGELAVVDVNDRGVWLAQGFFVVERLGIDFLCQCQRIATGFGETDEFFQPVGAGGFDMQARAAALQSAADGRVDRELVRSGMHAQFQCGWKAVAFDGMRDHREVVVEFFFKLCNITHVIDALVESSGEFRSDGLDRHVLVAESREDDQQLGGCLRRIGFIHRNLGNEIRAFRRENVTVDRTRFLSGKQELVGNPRRFLATDVERRVDTFDVDAA